MSRRPRLIAVDGANGRALLAAAERMAVVKGVEKSVSRWDASGLFEQLVMAGDDISTTSSRLLLLLYAADLAFRLRWEIEPALAEGHTVVAAPYVDTAMAFGRACGLPAKWLNNLFRFARKPFRTARDRDSPGFPATRDRGLHRVRVRASRVARRTGTRRTHAKTAGHRSRVTPRPPPPRPMSGW